MENGMQIKYFILFKPVGVHFLPTPAVFRHAVKIELAFPAEFFFGFRAIGVAFRDVACAAAVDLIRDGVSDDF